MFKNAREAITLLATTFQPIAVPWSEVVMGRAECGSNLTKPQDKKIKVRRKANKVASESRKRNRRK